MSHTLAEIRKFLMSAYSDQEIETLFFDHFLEARENLSDRMTKGDKVLHLVEYAYERVQLPLLLGVLRNERDIQFKRTFGDGSPEQIASEMTSAGMEPNLPLGSRAVLESCVAEHIAVQQQSIRYYARLVGGFVLLGLVIIGFALLVPEMALKYIIGLGGIFVMSCSAFPLRAMEAPRQEIGRFKILRAGLGALKQDLDFDARMRMESLVWQAVKKIAIGSQLDMGSRVGSAVS